MIPHVLLLVGASLAANPPVCEGGAVIDLNLHPVVALAEYADQLSIDLEGGPAQMERVGSYDTPVGYSSEARTLDVQVFLESKGLSRSALERGGHLLVHNGMFMFDEGGFTERCMLTYDKPSLDVVVAEQQLEEAKRAAARASVLECSPSGDTTMHAIKAPAPAKSIAIPGQHVAMVEDGTLSISISTPEHQSIARLDVTIQGEKLAATSPDPAGLFCAASKLEDLCVNTEKVFTLTGGTPFEIYLDFTGSMYLLGRCSVTR